MENLVAHSVAGNVGTFIGVDATTWGRPDTNMRGEELLVYLASNDLSILNRGAEPSFGSRNRREVLDLTLCSNCIRRCITNWYVSKERQGITAMGFTDPALVTKKEKKMA